MATQSNKTVLITRPALDADEFANDVRSLGFTALIEPLLGIIPTAYQTPDLTNIPGLVFTSANAVRVFKRPEALTDVPVFAVGMHTAEEARKRGYNKVLFSEGAAGDLAALIKKKLPAGGPALLHIRGEHTAMPLGDMLRKDGIKVETLIVYTAKSEDHFTLACHAALEKGAIGTATFFSRRTAETFIKLIRQEGLEPRLSGIKALCISAAVLECVREAEWAEAYSAERPDKAAMIDLLKTKCIP
jgi:uroporphyrinogen-III synthase